MTPPLWNSYFSDSSAVLRGLSFKSVYYADDLNAWKAFAANIRNEVLSNKMDECQTELHKWGEANQVQFDASKESKHILCLTEPLGSTSKLLGIMFDTSLNMGDAVGELLRDVGWKMKNLFRTKRFY